MTNGLDIFISYAHADDEVPHGATSGWVTTLVEELRKILRRKLGGNGAELWMDHQLAANENVTHELIAKLRASRTLVLVMSPGYQKSHWCQRELANHLLNAEATHKEKPVFVVEIEPIERRSWPRSLQDLQLTPVQFWHKEIDGEAPVLLGYPVPSTDEFSPYWRNLNELAHAIAKCLASDSSAKDDVKPRAVVVAETTDDLDDQRGALITLLRQDRSALQQGPFEPVPVRAYPRDTEAAFVDALRADLHDAALFVQLLGRYQGKPVANGESSVVALQAREALAAHRDRGLPLLQWRDPTLDVSQVAAESHRALLAGPFVLTCGFEQFKHEILTRLNAQPESAATPPAQAAGVRAGEGFRIFVDADEVDRDLAGAVCDALRAYDVDPVPASAVGAEAYARALEQQREAMRRCRGVLFVYGAATLSWLNARFRYAAQAMGLRRDDIWGAVLDAPPAAEAKVPFKNRNLLNLDCRNGFDPTALDSFVQALHPVHGGGGG